MIDSLVTFLNITHPNRDVQYWLVVWVKGEGPMPHSSVQRFGRLYILYNRLPYMSGYIW
jgi:hypothetical protein